MTDAMNLLSFIDASDAPVGPTWLSQFPIRTVFERDVLPAYLAQTRWYPERSAAVIHPLLASAIPFCDTGENLPWLACFETTQHGATTRYVLPMQIEWMHFDRERYNPQALATVRQGVREGTLLDVATDQIFIALLLRNLHQSLTVEESDLRLEFRPTTKFSSGPFRKPENIRAVQTEQSNSTALVDSDYVVKIYRKLESGINPEIEMGRFLTEVAGFTHTPALLGSVELVEGDIRSAVAIVHAFVENQGDAWAVTSGYLDRFVEGQRLLPASEYTSGNDVQLPYLLYMSQIGKRVAEMHLSLAGTGAGGITDFAPESIQPADVLQWREDLTARVERVFDTLEQETSTIREADRPSVDKMLAQRPILHDRLNAPLPPNSDGLKICHHGDLHLGQILIVTDDIFIIDFEGEPRRAIGERRRKAPAARDVAGLIRSIDYSTTAALDRALKVAPDYCGKVRSGLVEWRDRSTAALLAAYRQVVTKTRLWPADPQAADQMLDFFLLEKVLYEIEYELAHRPDWLRVPITGMLRILSQRPSEAS